MTVAPPAPMKAEEYLAWEQTQPRKSEYREGEVLMMAGASSRHISLTPRLAGICEVELDEGGGCDYLDTDCRLRVHASNSYYYPDGMIACPPNFVATGTIDNPCVIFEVLSESTASYDTRVKFGDYEMIPSVQEIVFIDSRVKLVDVFSRDSRDEDWRFRRMSAGVMTLKSVDVALDLDRLYGRWSRLASEPADPA